MGLGKRIVEYAESKGYEVKEKIKEKIPQFQQRKIDLAEMMVTQNQRELQYLDEILQELKFLNEYIRGKNNVFAKI